MVYYVYHFVYLSQLLLPLGAGNFFRLRSTFRAHSALMRGEKRISAQPGKKLIRVAVPFPPVCRQPLMNAPRSFPRLRSTKCRAPAARPGATLCVRARRFLPGGKRNRRTDERLTDGEGRDGRTDGKGGRKDTGRARVGKERRLTDGRTKGNAAVLLDGKLPAGKSNFCA